jgi:hypothetical protein
MFNTMNAIFGTDANMCSAPSGRTKCGATGDLGLKPQAICPCSSAAFPCNFAAFSNSLATFAHSLAAMLVATEVSTL